MKPLVTILLLTASLHATEPRLLAPDAAKLLIYYGGSPTVHLGWKRSGDLCLARLREDGFAFFEAEDRAKPAMLTTSPLRRAERPVRLVAAGEVKTNTELGNDGTDWTDEQARAAGWTPSPQGYSWRDTMRHAGKLVIMAAQTGAQESFDLDEVRLIPR